MLRWLTRVQQVARVLVKRLAPLMRRDTPRRAGRESNNYSFVASPWQIKKLRLCRAVSRLPV